MPTQYGFLLQSGGQAFSVIDPALAVPFVSDRVSAMYQYKDFPTVTPAAYANGGNAVASSFVNPGDDDYIWLVPWGSNMWLRRGSPSAATHPPRPGQGTQT